MDTYPPKNAINLRSSEKNSINNVSFNSISELIKLLHRTRGIFCSLTVPTPWIVLVLAFTFSRKLALLKSKKFLKV